MELKISFKDMQHSDAVCKHIKYRLSFTLARVEHEVEWVSITLADINGPKKGVDRQCQIIIKPRGLRVVVVTELSDDLYHSIDRGLARASQSLKRKLKRRKLLSQKRPASNNETYAEVLEAN